MVTMSVIALIVVALIAFGIMAFIGLFNRKMAIKVIFIISFARTLKMNWQNIKRLPSRLKILVKIFPRKRKLLLIKILKRLKVKQQERRIKRVARRQQSLAKLRKTFRSTKKPFQ